VKGLYVLLCERKRTETEIHSNMKGHRLVSYIGRGKDGK